MGKTYTTSFPGRVSYISLEPHLVIHDSDKAEQGQAQYIMIYYYVLIGIIAYLRGPA